MHDIAVVPETPSPSNAGRKRVNDSTRQSSARKRKAVRGSPELEPAPEDDLHTLHPEINARSSSHPSDITLAVTNSRLARELFVRNVELRKLIDENNIFRAFDLALAMQRTASAVGILLGRTSSSTNNGVQMDEATFRLLALSINNLLQAFGRLVLQRLSPDQEIQNPIGAAVYAVVSLFRSGLDALAKACRVEVEQRGLAKPLTSDTVKKATTKVDSTVFNTVVYIRDTLETIINSVLKLQPAQGRANTKPRSSPHSDLLEGIQYVLITTAGKLLSTLTFSDDAGLDIDEADLDLDLRAGMGTAVHNNKSTSLSSRASSEANHIFQMLRLALSTTPVDSLGQRKPKSKNQETPLQRAMTGQPLLRLQHTLIQTVFGVTEDDDLDETLRLPAEVVLRKRGSKAREEVQEDGGAMFVKSMFELIGWEYLAKAD
jgi:hypothetical protein